MRRFLAAATWGALLTLIVGASAIAAVGDLGEQRRINGVEAGDNSSLHASAPDLVYNSNRDEYLAVYPVSRQGKTEIRARLLAPGGAPLSPELPVSSMGPPGDANFAGGNSAVTYNPTADEYLVVWTGDDNTPPLVDGEREVFAQRLSATGAEIGVDDQRISTMGPNGSTSYGAFFPGVTFNPTANEYLVVWDGDDDTSPLVDGEIEIFAQRLSADGSELGADDQRISTMGPDGSAAYRASDPVVTHNPEANEYLIAWDSDDAAATQVNDEVEIFVQRLSASGAQVGTDDQRISTMGPDGDTAHAAGSPTATYNSASDEYLLAWEANGGPPLAPNEYEIYTQRLSAAGAEVGPNDQRISSMGPDGDPAYRASDADAVFDPTANEYIVSWAGDDDTPPLVNNEFEIFAQRIAADGSELGTDDQRVSSMGADGDALASADRPSAAYRPAGGEYLFVWQGDDAAIQPQISSGIFSRTMDAPDPPPADTTLDGATIDLAKKLKIKGKELKIKLDAGCAEACTASAAGAVSVKPAKGKLAAKAQRLKLAPATASIAAGQTTKLTLKLKGSKAKRKKLTRKLVGAVRRGAKAKAAIAVTLTDAAGNAAVVDDAAKLKAK